MADLTDPEMSSEKARELANRAYQKALESINLGLAITGYDTFFAIFRVVEEDRSGVIVPIAINQPVNDQSGLLRHILEWRNQPDKEDIRFHCYTFHPLGEELSRRQLSASCLA